MSLSLSYPTMRTSTLHALTIAIVGATLGLACQGEPSAGAGLGGNSSTDDLNDSTCGTSGLSFGEPIELELVEGVPPKMKGGAITPGVYELSEWRLWLDPQPGTIATQFRRQVFALEKGGILRMRSQTQTSSFLGSGDYLVAGNELTFRYECPGRNSGKPTLYTATQDTLTLVNMEGQELVYILRPEQ